MNLAEEKIWEIKAKAKEMGITLVPDNDIFVDIYYKDKLIKERIICFDIGDFLYAFDCGFSAAMNGILK